MNHYLRSLMIGRKESGDEFSESKERRDGYWNGMKDEMLLCPASVSDGLFLLSEIMIAGNFGHSDPRMGTLTSHSGLRRQLSQASRRFKRNMRFVTTYPGEVFFEPYARMWHFAWKKLKLWRF